MGTTDAWQQLRAIVPIDHPILQAPMAGVSSPAMAAAVSSAGGLGSIGVGATSADGARDMIRAIRAHTDRPFNVNVFCHRPAARDPAIEHAWIERLRPELARFDAPIPSELHEIYRSFVEDDAMLAMLLVERPAVVSFHFGIPSSERVNALRNAGIVLFGSATSLLEARALVSVGVHVVVAQGYEAGGHRGVFDPDAPDEQLETLPLVRVLARSIDVPVVAAGGIMAGEDIDAALALGASAAQLGTAFIATDESLVDEGYRAALFSDAAHHTVMTRAISGRPARCLRNRFTTLGERIEGASIPAYPVAYDLGKALHAAARARNEFGFGAQWAGGGAPRVRRGPAAEIVRALVAEMR